MVPSGLAAMRSPADPAAAAHLQLILTFSELKRDAETGKHQPFLQRHCGETWAFGDGYFCGGETKKTCFS